MPTNFDEALDEIALKVSPISIYKGEDTSTAGRELFKKEMREAIDKYLIGELEPTPPTNEWVTWGDGMQQHLLGRNS